MKRTIAPLLAAVVLLGGCSAAPAVEQGSAPAVEETTAPPTPPTATELAEDIKVAVSAAAVITITEDNDPNDLIGRPTGYVDAAIVNAAGFDCTELGVACGATIEVWPTSADAADRAAYIMGILDESPIFGTEYHSVSGVYLLRVSGEIVPSEASTYEDAFLAATSEFG